MREIKFRAWDKKFKEMRQVRGINFDNKDLWLKIEDNKIMGANFFEVELMQYTGLKDINGKEIYEGDIVHQTPSIIGDDEVEFTGAVKFYDGSWYIDDTHYAVELFSETCENEVVGNVYEDNELLEE